MPFIWNDKTYWKRYKESAKIQAKTLLPMTIISFILWKIFLNEEIHEFAIFFLSLFSGGTIYAFMGIFKLYPNPGIPDTYSPFAQRLMYIVMFIVSCTILYIFIAKVIFRVVP